MTLIKNLYSNFEKYLNMDSDEEADNQANEIVPR